MTDLHDMDRLWSLTERYGALAAEVSNLHRADELQRRSIDDLGKKLDALGVQIQGVSADLRSHIDRKFAEQERLSPTDRDAVKLSAREMVMIMIGVAMTAVILTYVAVTQMGVRHIPGAG